MSNSADIANDSQTSPHWYILGAGAIGCLWACYLHKAGFSVTLVLKNSDRKQQFIKTGGIKLIDGNSQAHCNIRACLLEELAPTSIEKLLLATKSIDAMSALSSIAFALQQQATILLLQNGMESQQQIATAYPQARVYCAVTTEGAYCPEPFTVTHAGRGTTAVGALNDAAKYASQSLLAALPSSKLDIHKVDTIEQKLWEKLAINCAINGLTAIYGCTNGELNTIAQAKARMARICQEVEAVAKTQGIELCDSFAHACQVIDSTALNRSSMLQDVENQRRTEMPDINGFICQLAEQYQIPCPENRHVRDTVLGIEAQYNA